MKNKEDICLNCERQLNNEAAFCPQCGQKAIYNSLSIKDLFKNFVDSFLNFDIKVFRSLRDIWIPNKITKAYVYGKRTNYVHPFRFYFICLVIFFGLIAIHLNTAEFEDTGLSAMEEDFKLHERYQKIAIDLDSLYDTEILDTLEKRLFDNDILKGDPDYLNIEFGFWGLQNLKFSKKDLLTLEPDSLIAKYKIENKFSQFLTRQTIKMQKKPEDLLRSSIANMLWGIILITIIMSFVLKLLFIRHQSYLVEHFLHISHFHCLLLLMVSFLLILQFKIDIPEPIYAATVTLGIIFFNYCLKRYYNQGFFKILFKSLIIGLAYTFALSLVITIIFIFTAILF